MEIRLTYKLYTTASTSLKKVLFCYVLLCINLFFSKDTLHKKNVFDEPVQSTLKSAENKLSTTENEAKNQTDNQNINSDKKNFGTLYVTKGTYIHSSDDSFTIKLINEKSSKKEAKLSPKKKHKTLYTKKVQKNLILNTLNKVIVYDIAKESDVFSLYHNSKSFVISNTSNCTSKDKNFINNSYNYSYKNILIVVAKDLQNYCLSYFNFHLYKINFLRPPPTLIG